MVTKEGRALVVAVNKWDTVENKQKALRDLRETVAESLAQVPGVPLIAISARAETGLDQLMREIVKIYEIWNKRVPTPSSTGGLLRHFHAMPRRPQRANASKSAM